MPESDGVGSPLEAGGDAGSSAAAAETTTEDVPSNVLQPQPHEHSSRLLFAAPDDPDGPGLQRYRAIVAQFDELFGCTETIRAAGDEWQLAHDDDGVQYWESQIAPPPDAPDSIDGGLYEYSVLLDAVDSVGEKTVNVQFRAAFSNSEHVETGEPIQSLPDDLPRGVRVQINSSNIAPRRTLDVLQALADELLDVDPDYFAAEDIHPWSRVTNLAYYVRVRRDVSEDRIVSEGGVLERLTRFGSNRRGKGELKWDNEEIMAHYQKVAMNPTNLGYLYGDHRIGKHLKSYHMKNPESAAGSVTSHPKLEVQYSTEYSTHDTAAWHAAHADDGEPCLEDVRDELETFLLNALGWGGLPLQPDSEVYVADQYWDIEAFGDERSEELAEAVVDDPTDVVAEQRRELVTDRLLQDPPTDAEQAVLEARFNGGVSDVEELAEEADVGTSTVYRVVEKFRELLTTVHGRLETRDSVVYDHLCDFVDRLGRDLSNVAESIRRLVRDRVELDDESALMQWGRRYGVEVIEQGRELEIRIQRATAMPETQIGKIIAEGAKAAFAVGANTWHAFVNAAVIANGKRYPNALTGGPEIYRSKGGEKIRRSDLRKHANLKALREL